MARRAQLQRLAILRRACCEYLILTSRAAGHLAKETTAKWALFSALASVALVRRGVHTPQLLATDGASACVDTGSMSVDLASTEDRRTSTGSVTNMSFQFAYFVVAQKVRQRRLHGVQ